MMPSSAVYSVKHEDTMSVDILLIDDHQLVREGLSWLLSSAPIRAGIIPKVVQTDSRATALIKVRGGFQPSVVLFHFPTLNGLDDLRTLIEQLGPIPIVVLSAEVEPSVIVACFKEGAKGYIPKTASPELLRSALALVLAGGMYVPQEALLLKDAEFEDPRLSHNRLTPRQREVLRCVAQGLSNKNIAQALGMSESTVRVHVAAILRVLNVENRTQAAGTPLARALLENENT